MSACLRLSCGTWSKRLFSIICIVGLLLLLRKAFYHQAPSVTRSPVIKRNYFVPNITRCRQRNTNETYDKICPLLCQPTPITSTYRRQLKEFMQVLNSSKIDPKRYLTGGSTFGAKARFYALRHLAQMPFIHQACESGFNAGLSSFNYLTANPAVKMLSFELYRRNKEIIRYLQKAFANRFSIEFGDSRTSISRFAADHAGFVCDFIFVDGGHDYSSTLADLMNFARLANLTQNIVTADDIRMESVARAWAKAKSTGVIRDLNCHRRDIKRLVATGIAVGSVVKRPK